MLLNTAAIFKIHSQWSVQTSNTNRHLNSIHFGNNEMGFAVGDSGTILAASNGGDTFSELNPPLNEILYSVHFPTSDTGYFAGQNGAILKYIDLQITGIETINSQPMIFPNPFSTHAIWKIPNHLIGEKPGLAMYDCIGTRVRFDYKIGDGEIAIKRGNLPAGIYHVVLQSGGNLIATSQLIAMPK
jgi:hypothetical protein